MGTIQRIGCAISPAPTDGESGDLASAELLENNRQKEEWPATAASVITDSGIIVKG